jgi:DNA invertase Pin-like site-specific DNA recombinase
MARTTAKPATAQPTAYSYVRFSSPQQAQGDSLRRQHELRDAWLKRAGAVLDTSVTLKDEGVGAFTGGHRVNPDRHALAAFLELVKRGRVQRGSYLVVESLDRLSREHIRPALTLLLNLIDAGVRVVQLLPVEAVYDDKVEPMQLMMAIMELSRGHSESRMKSERVGGAWKEKKRQAAENGEPITRRVPAWLSVEGGRFVLDKDKATTIRRVFEMVIAGHGVTAITKRLNAERVPPIGRAECWVRSYVMKLLTSRTVVGEYQPHTRRNGQKRAPEGKPITGYFPPVVTDDQWHAARAALVSRTSKGGRASRRVHLFQGLWRDARDGAAFHIAHKGALSIVNYRAVAGVPGATYVGFPLPVFEDAILSRLREINPREVLPERNDGAEKVLTLTGRLADVEGRIEALKVRMVEDDIGPLVDVLRKLETNRAKAAAELAEAQREAASPLSNAWGEARTLLDALMSAPDEADARTRLRAALRRVVESVRCLFLTKCSDPRNEGKVGRVRVAAVQVWFAGGAHRDYLITHTPATGGSVGTRPGRTSVATAFFPSADPLDLRKRKDAAKLLAKLESIELVRPGR